MTNHILLCIKVDWCKKHTHIFYHWLAATSVSFCHSWYLGLNIGISPFTAYLIFVFVTCFGTVWYLDFNIGISPFTITLYLDLLLLLTQILYLLLNSWISTQQLVQNKIKFLTDYMYNFMKGLYYYIARFFFIWLIR